LKNYKRWFKKSRQEIAFITKDPILLLAVLLIFGSLIIFILYPLCKVITFSVFSKGQFSFLVLKDVISNWYFRQGFYNSIIMGILTSIIGAGIGFLFAFTLARTDIPFKKAFHLVAIIPIISPPFIGAMAIIMLFGNNGLITSGLLGINNFKIYGFRGLLFAQVITFFPVAYITLRGVLESISPTLEDAAFDLGGSRWKKIVRIRK